MRGEQAVHALARERVDDEEMRRRGRRFRGLVADLVRITLDLGEGGSKPQRLPADHGPKTVGLVFARAADGHLHQHRGERRDEDRHQRPEPVRMTVAAISAEQRAELEPLRQHRNGAADAGGNRHGQRVAVLHVREFVRHDAGDFLGRQHLEQPRGRADGSARGPAPGRESVGLRIVHDVDPRHRQAGLLRQMLHDAEELAARAAVDLTGAVHAEHHLVRTPQAEEVHAEGEDERDHHAALAADERAEGDENAGKGSEQDGRLGEIERHGLPIPVKALRVGSATRVRARPTSRS